MGRDWWVSSYLTMPNGEVIVISWVIWVIGSIVLHELGHGWAALACGDDTPRESGHMTWNPLVHMGWPSLIAFAILGIAWGAMPINPNRFRHKGDEALVALAGPMMNVLLAVGAIVLYAVWVGAAGGYWFGAKAPNNLYDNVLTFLRLGALLNIALAVFNLLPVPPLDGFRVLMTFIPPLRDFFRSSFGQVAALVVIVLLFTSAPRLIFQLAGRSAARAIDAAVSVLVPSAHLNVPSGP
jgi:Zn-dependent protease